MMSKNLIPTSIITTIMKSIEMRLRINGKKLLFLDLRKENFRITILINKLKENRSF